MQSIVFWVVLSGAVFIAALLFFFRAITKKSMQNIYFSIALVLIAGVMGIRAGWLFVQKSYHVVVKTAGKRMPQEVYNDMFGNASAGCTQAINAAEPVVPRIDCCTYLEFKTCPEELKRIIAQNRYQPAAADMPPGTPPVWWVPSTLGSNPISLSCTPDEDSYQLLIFSADSTHAFYCYSTD